MSLGESLNHSFSWFIQKHYFIQEQHKLLSSWVSLWIIHSPDSFKTVIHSRAKQVTVFLNPVTESFTLPNPSKSSCSFTALCTCSHIHTRVCLYVRVNQKTKSAQNSSQTNSCWDGAAEISLLHQQTQRCWLKNSAVTVHYWNYHLVHHELNVNWRKCPCRHWRDKRHHQNDVQWGVCETNWISTVVASSQKIIIQHNVSCMGIAASAFPLRSACYGSAQNLRSISSRLNRDTNDSACIWIQFQPAFCLV